MKANYHTHTSRCGHASGTDEQYVRAAIKQGFDELGFSDHVPWPYEDGFTNPGVRMSILQLSQYLNSVRELAQRYQDKIHILTGFECEYFPKYMSWLEDMAKENELDYLIFGNHYDESDEYGFYYGSTHTPQMLSRYVKSSIAGIQTGLFSYFAHPDLFMRSYKPFDENCRAAAKDLCQACKAMNLPMEYNVHDRYISGFTHRKSYPNPEFFEIALQEGVRVIIGLDAHEPRELSDATQWNHAMKELEPFGERHIDHLTLNK